jgi:hypothetical protein
MVRQQHDLSDSSLDLLLDTVTNAFGGILFLSILIVLMLRMTSEQTQPTQTTADQPSQAELLQLQTKLADARSELSQLQAVSTLQDDFAESLTDESLKVRHQALQAERAKRDAASEERARQADRLAQEQQQNNSLREQLAQSEENLAQQQARLKELQEILGKETAARTRSASLPQTKATSKMEVAIVVRYGRAYFVHHYDSAGLPTGLNTDDLLVLEDGFFMLHLTPKPYAGFALADEASVKRELRAALASLPSRHHYVALAVFDDSFEEFGLLKKCLIDLGYEYRLIPIAVGDSVAPSSVGNPRVQ